MYRNIHKICTWKILLVYLVLFTSWENVNWGSVQRGQNAWQSVSTETGFTW